MAHAIIKKLSLGVGNTGKAASLRAQLIGADAANVGSVIASGFAEIGTTGDYLFYYASVPDGHWGGVKVYDVGAPTTILWSDTIDPVHDENADVKTSTRNATTPPTAAAIRSEMDTNSTKLIAILEDTAVMPTAAAIADAVHDEALSGHQTAGTAGKALTDAAAGLTGSTPVGHSFGSTDALRFLIAGSPVDGGIIRAYLKSEYDTGVYTVLQTRLTGSDGRWIAPMMLDAGTYTLVFSTPDEKQATTKEITVS